MARKLYYKIIDDGRNAVSDSSWEDVLRLQHWYNSEFIWTAGRLAFKMYAVFPNPDSTAGADELWHKITQRRHELEQQGLSENEMIHQLESEGLIIVQKGGYFDKCLASGFTRVAANEFNAYLVCEFLLKISTLIPTAIITAYDEGEFIKAKQIQFRNGGVIIRVRDELREPYYRTLVGNRHVFAIVDSGKYDQFPRFQTTINDFNDLTIDEKLSILKDWNWLGFENNYDINGDDIQGFDLNKKVARFELEVSSTGA